MNLHEATGLRAIIAVELYQIWYLIIFSHYLHGSKASDGAQLTCDHQSGRLSETRGSFCFDSR